MILRLCAMFRKGTTAADANDIVSDQNAEVMLWRIFLGDNIIKHVPDCY